MAVPLSSLPEALVDVEEAQTMAPVLLESILAQRDPGGSPVTTEPSVSQLLAPKPGPSAPCRITLLMLTTHTQEALNALLSDSQAFSCK